MTNIPLTAGIRQNLLALTNTKSNIQQIQGHLATGLSVSSATDDAVKYFTAKSLTDRATDLGARKDSIDQGVSTVTTASDALTSIETLVQQMKGIIDSSRSGSATQRKAYSTQLNNLSSQIQNLVSDASYKGLNLINSSTSTLTVYFSDKAASNLKVTGVNFNASKLFVSTNGSTGLGVKHASTLVSTLGFGAATLSGFQLSIAANLASFNGYADKAQNYLDATIANIRAQSANMGSNVAILNVRLDFTKTYINDLQGGSDKLTVADLNSESANLVSLQTRQSLGIQSLSMANTADQAVLQLFR
jgi:flagellin-like hook-associated protein FlgL